MPLVLAPQLVTPTALIPQAVNFDGTNDYLLRGGGLAGASDGQEMTFSCWWKSGASTAQRILSSTGQALDIFQEAAGTFRVDARNVGGPLTRILRINTTGTVNDSKWHHLLVSLSLDTPQPKYIYVDDSPDLNVTTFTDDIIDHTVADWAIGAQTDASDKANGDLYDLWYDDSYLDISIEANRRKFIDASGRPVDLGADGSTPTGASPLIFQSEITSRWHINKGTAGGFNLNGVLATASIPTVAGQA